MLQFENLFEKAILMCPMVVPLRYSSKVRVETVRSLYQFLNKHVNYSKALKTSVQKNHVNGYDRPASDRY